MASGAASGSATVRVPPRSRARTALRAVLIVLLLLIAGLVVLGLASLPSASVARERLEEGRLSLEQGRNRLVAGDPEAALSSFRAARLSFGEATTNARSGSLRLLARVPMLGRNVDVVDALARAGTMISEAGVVLSRGLASMPGGLEALLPQDGRLPIEQIGALGATVAKARELADGAVAAVRDSPDSALLPPVSRARRTAESGLAPMASTLGTATELLDGLPEFFGADRPRLYLFGAENPAELRGTGGFIGAFSLLRIDDGVLSFSGFRPIQVLPLLDPDDVEPPNEDYARLYDPQRAANGFWLNANMTPDFPSAAIAYERAYAVATGTRVDGFVTADPFALAALLRATGPAFVPGVGREVTAQTVVPFLTNEAYAEIGDSDERKRLLGSVAESVVARFLNAAAGAKAVQALVGTAANGHVKVHVADPDLQRALEATSAAGAFAPPANGSDFLSVVQNNGAGSKIDHYLDRTVRYSVRLLDDGAAAATTEVLLRNGAPDHGQPKYVIGPNVAAQTEPGQNVTILNVYCGECGLTRASRNGEPISLGTDTEKGSTFYQDYLTIDSGEDAVVRMSYQVEHVWSGSDTDGVYRLAFENQTTIRGTQVRVEIVVPSGTEVVQAPDGARVDGRAVVWEGVPEGDFDLEVSFAAPFPQRIWSDLVDLFSD